VQRDGFAYSKVHKASIFYCYYDFLEALNTEKMVVYTSVGASLIENQKL
jgi:hypothetical protein